MSELTKIIGQNIAAVLPSSFTKKSNRDITILMSLIRIVAAAILIPLFGMSGAVAATVIYRISTVAIMHYIMRTRY